MPESVAAAPPAILRGEIQPGMSFNQRAWAMVSRVPAGHITTYATIAKALGSPGAARAVGNAMRTNPYAPEVPCHRVVGSDGRLTGYAGGLDQKQQMLRDEGVPVVGGRVDVSEPYDVT